MRWMIAALLLCAVPVAHSQSVQRCVGPDGAVTFTQAGCGTELLPEQIYEVYDSRPSVAPPPEMMTQPEPYPHQHQQYPQRQHQQYQYQQQLPPPSAPRSRVTVVGGSDPRESCSTGLSDRDLRTAKVRGEIVPGMSRKDVESIYGAPNRNSPARGAGSSTYWNDKYLSATTVRYDSNGCVESSYQSGHRGR